MSVITLTPSLLNSASLQLAAHVMGSGFCPQVIIGILNGGANVARMMRESLPHEALYCEVSISRPSTQHKRQSATHRLLQHLPLRICDLLRIVESRVTEYRSTQTKLERIGEIVFSTEVEERLRVPGCKVLIVDDAIDSGATIQKLQTQLLARFPKLDMRTSVITVTTPHPVCDADFSLYHNRTLCRFPWSNDYRNP